MVKPWERNWDDPESGTAPPVESAPVAMKPWEREWPDVPQESVTPQVTENPQPSTAMPWDSDPYAQEPESSTPPPDPGFGMRHNPEDGLKGMGYFGKLQMKDGSGNFATEMSGGINIGGKEMDVPLLVPTLTQEQIDHLLSGKPATDEIWDAAAAHAKDRLAKGLSVWHDTPQQSTVSLATDMSNVEDPSLPLPLRIAQRIAKPLFSSEGYLAQKGKERGVVGNVAAGLYEGGQNLISTLVARPISPESADAILDKSAAYEQELQKTDVGISGEIARTARGVLSSATTSVAGAAVGGAPGAIFFASGQEMNSAINEGKKAGLEGDALNRYVLRAGAIEAAPAAFMQAIGLPGAEGVIAKVFGKGVQEPVKRGILAALKQVGVGTAQEIPEELVTEIGHSVNTAMSGVDPNAVSPGSLFDTVYDTTLQTVGTMGLFSSPSIARGAVDTVTGKSKAQAADVPLTETPIPLTPEGTPVDVLPKPAGAPDVPAPPDDDNVTSGINDIEAEVLFGEPAPVEEPVVAEEVAPVEEPVVKESLTTEPVSEPELPVEPPVEEPAVPPRISETLDRAAAALDRVQQPPQGVDVTTDDILAGRTVDDVAKPVVPDTMEGVDRYGVYKTKVKGKGEMFAVRGEGARGGGDTLMPTYEEAVNESELQRKRDEERAKSLKEVEDKAVQDEAVRAEKERYLDEYTADKTPMLSGKIRKSLKNVKRYESEDGKKYTGESHEVIPQMVADGYAPVEVDRNGKKSYRIAKGDRFFDINKTEFEYATWNTQNVTNVPPEPVAAEAPVPETAQGEAPATAGMPVQLVSEPEQPGTQAETTGQGDTAGTVTPEPSPAPEPWQMTRDEYYQSVRDYEGAAESNRRKKIDWQQVRGEVGFGFNVAGNKDEVQPENFSKFTYEQETALQEAIKKQGFDSDKYRVRDQEEQEIGEGQGLRVITGLLPTNPEHYRSVQSALTEGKPVPDAVLADYPDLRDRVKLPTVEPVEQESPVMYGGKTGTDFVKDRWDNGKLGYRAGISLKEWGTKSGKMSKQAEKIAESKWDDLSPAAQRVIANRIQRDYPSVAVEPVAVEQPVQKPKRGKKQWTGFLPPQNQQTPAQQPTRKPTNVFDRDREIANKEYVLGELDKAIADAPDSAVQEETFIRAATPEEQYRPQNGMSTLKPAQEGYRNEYRPIGSGGPGYYNIAPLPTVTIESPGGGKIKLVNSKSNISDYKRRVEREFVTQVSRPTAKKSKLDRKPKGPTVPKLGTMSKESAAKVGNTIRSRSTRPELQEIYKHNGDMIAANGPVLVSIKGMATGKMTAKPAEMDTDKYLSVTPDSVATVNTGELYRTVNQASKLAGRGTSTELYKNPDGTIGVRSAVTKKHEEPAEYTYNVQEGADNLGIYEAGNLLDIAESVRDLGSESVAIGRTVNDKGVTSLYIDGKGYRFVTLSAEPRELKADFPAYNKSITHVERYAIRTATAKHLSSEPATADDIQSFMDTAGMGYTLDNQLNTPPPGLPDQSTGRRMYAYAGIPLQDGDVIQATTNRDKRTVTFYQGTTMQDVAHEVLHINITSVSPAEADALAAKYGQDWERKEELIARDAADYYLVMREQGVLRKFYERIRDALRDLMRAMGLTRHPVSVEQFFRSVYTGRRARRMRYVGGERFHAMHHGTPHTFAPEPGYPHGRFRLDKMGTGEGAQAYGWGIYFAEIKGVAGSYKRDRPSEKVSIDGNEVPRFEKGKVAAALKLQGVEHYTAWAVADRLSEENVSNSILSASSAIKATTDKNIISNLSDVIDALNLVTEIKTESSLYTLDIPNDAIPKMLLWDAPLSEQPEWVKAKLKNVIGVLEVRRGGKYNNNVMSDWTGQDLYGVLKEQYRARDKRADEEASKVLQKAGIPGLRFLDGDSRAIHPNVIGMVEYYGSVEKALEVAQLRYKQASFGDVGYWKKIVDQLSTPKTYNTVVWDQSLLDRISLLERNGNRLDQMQPMQSGSDIDSEYSTYLDNLDTANAAAVIQRTAAQKGYEFAAHLGVQQRRDFTKLNTWGGAIYLSSTKQPENGGYYVDLGANPLTVDGDINDQTVANAQKQGYTSVTFADGKYAVFDSAQIKSAATVTRDELGRIIPPSERFNVASADVRYAVKPQSVKAPEPVERRMKARNDLDRDTIAKRIEKAGGVVKWMWRGLTDTDWYINQSGEAGKLMFRLFDSRMNEAKTRTAETVVSLIRNLNTDQYNLASRYLSHADALESVTRAEQYTDPVEFNANMERFVFGWEETVAPMPVNATYEQFRKWRTSVIDQMKVYMGQLEAEIAEQPAVQEMLEKRRALVTDTQRRIVDRKLLPQNMLNKRNEYFHREIHMAGTIMEKHLGGVSQYAKQVRSFMKKRGTGVNALSAEFDPSSDYLLSEMAWLTDANMEIAKVDWWNDMERSFGYPIKALKSACREMNYTAYVGGPENRDRLRQIQKELNRIYESFIDPVTGKRVEKPEPWAAQIIAALHEEAAAIDGTWRSRKYMGYMLNKIKQDFTFEYDPFSDTDSDTNMINELADILDDPAAPGLMKWYVAEIFKTMADVRGKIKTSLQNDPTKQYLTWQNNLPDGYDLVQPDEGHVMYPVCSVSAKALEHFAKAAQTVAHHAGATGIPLEDLVLSIPKGNTVYVPGGPKPQLVVPMDIADKINHGMKVKEKHWVARAFGDVTSKFQRWVLFNWATYPVYALKNSISDVENFVNGLALNPKQAMEFSGDMLRATKELRQYIYKKDFENISPELRAFRSSGGLGSNEMNSELLNQFDPTDTTAINKATNVLDYVFGYKYTQQMNAFRENLLRYAWYLNAKRNLETTGTMPHWGGSKSADIMQVMDKLGTHEAAALWANNQMLNYGNLTLFGQWLRDSKMGIFYSFTELSIRSVAQNVRSNFEYGNRLRNNIATTVRENPFLNVPVVRQLGLSASYAAQTAATLAMLAKMGAVWGAVALWNAVFFGDDDDELPEEYKYMPHLCVGRNADGSVRVLTNISMLGSVMEFLGVYEAAKMLTDTGLEKTDLGKMAKNMVMGGSVQRMVGHVNPYFKTGMELITGQSFFPDITHPRPKDRFDLLTGMFGMEDVGLGLKGEILADGTRARTHPYQRAMRVKQVDPLDEKRYEIYALYDAYRASVGKPDESNNFRGADRFLKNLRHAAKQNDPVAFRENVHQLWINRGMNQGKVTRSINDSLRYLDPMERVDKEDRKPFMEFLTPRQREAYQETVVYGKELRRKILQMYQTYGVMGPKK